MSLRKALLLLLVIAAPPLAVAMLLALGFAVVVVIYSKTGLGIDLELVAAVTIALLSVGYGGVSWWACGRWSTEGNGLSIAKRLAIAIIASILGAALGYAACVVAANIGIAPLPF
jgi:hypothetical protein